MRLIKLIKRIAFVRGLGALLMLSTPSTTFANLVEVGSVNLKGTGFGNMNTILTVQALGQAMGGTESGCVGIDSAGKHRKADDWLVHLPGQQSWRRETAE